MYSLDVIVPFYNEESYLEESVNRLLSANIHNKIYLVDNNSTDSSSRIALNFSIKRDDVVYLETENKPGKGVGIRTAIENVLATHVVIHDADLEYFPEDLKAMKKISIDNPRSLILGSRFIGIKKRKNNYKRTIFANKFLSAFFSLVYSHKVSDVATCYKLLPSELLKSMNLKENGFAIEVEILAKYLKNPTPRILEEPISYEGRTYEEGKKISFLDGFSYIFKTVVYIF
jgi:glycosyltransferase involved in cell wall biosynthesis